VEHQLHVRIAKQGRHEAALKVARQGGHGADAQDLPVVAPPFLQRGHQLATCGRDGVGVGQRNASRLGEHQTAPLSLEQGLPQLGLELTDLRGQRALGHPQMLRRPREVSLVRDGAEVLQVVVVEPTEVNLWLIHNTER
jgi:hypothetical protein